MSPDHPTLAALEAALPAVRAAPRTGRLEMIVRRPRRKEREVLEEAVIDPVLGLVGDRWSTPDADSPRPLDPERQLTLVDCRVLDLLAGSRAGWSVTGDQLCLDLDLSEEAVPVGTRFTLGEVELRVTAAPHTGCTRFAGWFGPEARAWVNSPEGRTLRLRGCHAIVLRGGVVRVGDVAIRAGG